MFVTGTAQRRGTKATTNGVVPNRYNAVTAAPGYRVPQSQPTGTSKRKRVAEIGHSTATGLTIQGDMDAPVDRTTAGAVGTSVDKDKTFPVTFATNRTPMITTPLRIPAVVGNMNMMGSLHINGNLVVDGTGGGGASYPPYDSGDPNDAAILWPLSNISIVGKTDAAEPFTINELFSSSYYTLVNDWCLWTLSLVYSAYVEPIQQTLIVMGLPRQSEIPFYTVVDTQQGYAAEMTGDDIVLSYVVADQGLHVRVRNDTQETVVRDAGVTRFAPTGWTTIQVAYKYIKIPGDRGYVAP